MSLVRQKRNGQCSEEMFEQACDIVDIVGECLRVQQVKIVRIYQEQNQLALFDKVYEHADGKPAIGCLTSQNRDAWADAREILLKASPANAGSLKDIEAASFVVCLDDAKPVTLEERSRQYWHGDGKNRWFDKPLQFIVNDNGTAGFMGEHSMMDGTPTQRINDYVNAMIFGNKLDFENPASFFSTKGFTGQCSKSI
ncbi:hypothetical protein KEM56_007586 [Ascosphaera pollenicola]|nr:hypothetical protein KEM56_007586 [Ascosphaera pollenicola]